MTETIKLTEKTFDNVMSMLNSPDKENVVLGLSCIEELNIKTGLVYLLLMKKLGNVTDELWRENAPKKLKYLKGMGVEGTLTYKKVLDLLRERKVPIKDIQFFLNKFALYLHQSVREDYAIIDAIDIQIKLKLHDTVTNE